MKPFPAQYSTLSARELKSFIAEMYGVALTACRLLSRNVSDTYLVECDKGKYIFRVYRTAYRPLGEIKGEVELLDILNAGSVPVSYPIADASANKIQVFDAAEGVRYGILFSYAEGQPAMVPDNTQLKIIGREMAKMHNITAQCSLENDRPVYDIHSTLQQPLEIVHGRFTGLEDEYKRLQNIAARAAQRLNDIDTSAFSYGYCHYDLLPKNFHFDGHNNITFFDFDWCGRGFLVNDLMTFKIQLFFLVHFKAINAETANGMFNIVVNSYREHRALSDTELSAIPHLGIAFFTFAFGFYEQNFDDFAVNLLTPKFIKERVAQIETWGEMGF